MGGVERGGGGGGDATSDRCGDDQPALRAATRELMRLWRSVFDMRERERGEGGGGGVEATGEWRSALVGVVTGSVSPSSSFEVVGVRLTRRLFDPLAFPRLPLARVWQGCGEGGD